MPKFYKISFDASELEALRLACERQAEVEGSTLDNVISGPLEGVVIQKMRADDMLLVRQTVGIFKPGQDILITTEDLGLMKECLQNFEDMADYALADAINRAIHKIEGCKPEKS